MDNEEIGELRNELKLTEIERLRELAVRLDTENAEIKKARVHVALGLGVTLRKLEELGTQEDD